MSIYKIRGINLFSSDDDIHEKKIPIITKSQKFKNFIDYLNKNNLNIIGLKIHDVKWFYDSDIPDPEKLELLHMELITLDKQTNTAIHEVIFLNCETDIRCMDADICKTDVRCMDVYNYETDKTMCMSSIDCNTNETKCNTDIECMRCI